jgi:hypothetical protein
VAEEVQVKVVLRVREEITEAETLLTEDPVNN